LKKGEERTLGGQLWSKRKIWRKKVRVQARKGKKVKAIEGKTTPGPSYYKEGRINFNHRRQKQGKN